MAIQRIAFLYPGAMGASLAHTLHTRQSHLTLLTDVSGRSQSTISRSEAAGLINTPLAEIVQRSDLIVSILPPSEALALAKSFVSHLDGRPASHSPPIYLDANAISPASVKTLADILSPHNVPFIDGCVIGLPAREGHDPKLYLSADEKWEKELQAVAEALRGSSQAGEDGKGLKVRVMDRAGEGAASALKMCYGGINKGVIGLASIMIMGACLSRGVSLSLPSLQNRRHHGGECVVYECYALESQEASADDPDSDVDVGFKGMRSGGEAEP